MNNFMKHHHSIYIITITNEAGADPESFQIGG